MYFSIRETEENSGPACHVFSNGGLEQQETGAFPSRMKESAEQLIHGEAACFQLRRFTVAKPPAIPLTDSSDESASCYFYLSCTNRVCNIVLSVLFIHHHMPDYSRLCFFFPVLDDVIVK